MLTDLAFALVDGKKDIRIITCRMAYDDPAARFSAHENVNGVRVSRVWTTRFGRKSLWGRALDYFTFYLSATWRLAAIISHGDIVVAKTDPPLISVPAAAVAKFKGATLINWIQDLFPEVACVLKIKGMIIVSPVLRRLRNFSLRFARANVVLGRRMAQRVIAQGVRQETVTVIHNWADGSDIMPIPREQNRLRQEWGLRDELVVGYSGNMGRAHDFTTLVEAASLLNHDRRIVFLFVGDGAKRGWVEHEVKKRGLNNVIFKPYQPRDRLGQSLCVPDIHAISLQPELEGLIVPSKFYGVAAAGRPTLFIGDPAGEIAGILSAGGCGVSVRVGDADAVVRNLYELLANKETIVRMGQNARSVFEHSFDKEIAFAAWRRMLSEGVTSQSSENRMRGIQRE